MRRCLRIFFLGLFCSCLIQLQTTALAVPAMGMGYEPKYPADFKHFDYVSPNSTKGGEITLSGLGTFDSLNPYLLKGLAAGGLGVLVFESLLEKSLDEPFSMYGLIAEDFYLAADRLSVTFHINPAARFSNGRQVTAEDVKFSFDTLMSKAAHPQYRVYYGDIESAEVIDELTVRFHFKRRNRELHMIAGDIPIFAKEWIGTQPFEKVDDAKPISSGPYLVDDYERGRFIRYRRNPDYWAKDLPVRQGMYNFDTITYKYYKDSTIAHEAFKAGEFDFFYENYSKRWARSHVGPRYDSGEIRKTELVHSNNAGMQGFAINIRRDKFKDTRVRKALTLAFDFEWANNQLFYQQYERCDSYFSNSELASTGLPGGKELRILRKYRDQIPASVFDTEWRPPRTDAEKSLRDNLKQARDLLAEAGWTVQDGVLKNAQGDAFIIDVLLVQKGFGRIFAPFAHNLKKLGIDMKYRTVDESLYKRRLDAFDFDMVVTSFPQSVSPGNELMNMFHSQSAELEGSRNLVGIADPVVDALIENIIDAEGREQLIIAAHALDRVMLHNEYLVPNWFIDTHRIAYRDKFQIPKTLPLYYEPVSWMLKTWSTKEKE
ncbi:MAG: ABC transporter substrate-binding protein [Gammaproteobacteria bacterium]|nr:extracellular solute-binding protein [Gammaproteobacteria bacterium]NNJ98616.1 ABC transporter substrate-binding protein [Gammaproteobacteria bacterium]